MLKPLMPGQLLRAAVEKGGNVSVQSVPSPTLSPQERERRSMLAGIVALLYENQRERRQRGMQTTEKGGEIQKRNDESQRSVEKS